MAIKKEKLCKRCDETKSADSFYRRRGGKDLSPYCKRCTKDQTLERQRRLKKECIDYLGGSCVKCGYNKCQAALEFHHEDPSQKDFSISHQNSTSMNESIRNELSKCALLCSNCHKEEHWGSYRPVLSKNKSPRKKALPKDRFKCKECKTTVSYNNDTCRPCSLKNRRVIDWPSKDRLLKMVKENGFLKTGRLLGVSDNAVRKALKR